MKMKMKTNTKAGRPGIGNHNQAANVVRKAISLKTSVKAGRMGAGGTWTNHNQAVSVASARE